MKLITFMHAGHSARAHLSAGTALRLLALLFLLPAGVQAQQSLFFPLDAADLAARQAQLTGSQAEIISQRLDSPLTRHLTLGHVDRAVLSGSEIRVLAGGEEVTFRRDLVEQREPGAFSWRGRTQDDGTFALFVVRDGQVTGSIRVRGQLFLLDPIGDDLHVLSSIDENAVPHHPEDWREHALEGLEADPLEDRHNRSSYVMERAQARAVEGPPLITLIVAYTASALAQWPNIEARVQLAVDENNLTFENSGIHHRLALAHVYETNTAESASIGTDLNRFAGVNNGFFDEVHGLRDQYQADLAALIAPGYTACGIARLFAETPERGFSVTRANCLVGWYVFAHEIGHNLGADHNPEQDSNPFFVHGHGTTHIGEGWKTVMAYNRPECPFGGCQSIPYWSSPDVLYNGTPTGDGALRNNVLVNFFSAPIVGSHRLPGFRAEASVDVLTVEATVAPGGQTTVPVTVASHGETHLVWHDRAVYSDMSNQSATDFYGYKWLDSNHEGGPNYDFIDISEIGTEIPHSSFTVTCPVVVDPLVEGYAIVALPFDLPFYGEVYSSLRVAVNGFVTVTSFNWCSSVGSMPSTTLPNGLIAPLWMNLDITDGSIYTYDTGDGRFIIQWRARRSGGVTHRNFQLIIYENGNFKFQYHSPDYLSVEGNTAYSYSIGIENPAGTDGLQVARSTWSYLRSGLAVEVHAPVEFVSDWSPDHTLLAVGGSATRWLKLDATGLEPGMHHATYLLHTNDPQERIIMVPVALTVGQPASLVVDGGPGWRMLAPARTDLTVSHLADLNLVQGVSGFYDEAPTNLHAGYDGLEWTTFSGASDALQPGKGFLWYLYDLTFDPGGPSQSVALPMALPGGGPVPGADVVTTLHQNGSRWNLLGNPFDTSLDVSGLSGWTGADGLASAVPQVWDPNLGTGSYRLASELDNVLSAWQGFFLENATATQLLIPVSAQTMGADLTRPAAQEQRRIVAFELTGETGNGVLTDRAAVLLMAEGGTDGWDLLDATKLTPLTYPRIALAFVGERVVDGEAELALKAQESRPLFPADFDVELNILAEGYAGELTLSWPRVENVPGEWTLTLKDLETGEVTDLASAEQYTFSVSGSGNEARLAPEDVLATAGERPTGFAPRLRLSVAAAAVSDGESPLPLVTNLEAIYPNPFAAHATVAFALAEAAEVTVTLYDVLGRQVLTLADGNREAGLHTVALDRGALASGVYVLRLAAGDAVFTQRVTVVR
jgi:hypothetical protein